MLLTYIQVSIVLRLLRLVSTASIKTQLPKMIQLGKLLPFSLISSLLNPARTAEKVKRKLNQKMLENKDILALKLLVRKEDYLIFLVL